MHPPVGALEKGDLGLCQLASKKSYPDILAIVEEIQ
jgi:hypothetical protein